MALGGCVCGAGVPTACVARGSVALLGEVSFEGVPELHGGYVVLYLAADGVGDGSRLFGDDDADDVELLGDSDGAAVPQPEVGVNVGAESATRLREAGFASNRASAMAR